jgi:hypothetical protein
MGKKLWENLTLRFGKMEIVKGQGARELWLMVSK